MDFCAEIHSTSNSMHLNFHCHECTIEITQVKFRIIFLNLIIKGKACSLYGMPKEDSLL